MTVIQFLHIFAVQIFIIIIAYLVVKNPRLPEARMVIGLCFGIGLWCFSQIYVQNFNTPMHVAQMFIVIAITGVNISVVILPLLFARFTGRLKNRVFIGLMTVITLLAVYVTLNLWWTYFHKTTLVIPSPFGWVFNFAATRQFCPTWIFLLFKVLSFGTTVYVLADFIRKAKSKVMRNHAIFFLVWNIGVIPITDLAGIVLPSRGIVLPDVAGLLNCIGITVLASYVIRFKFPLTPYSAAMDIINAMTDVLLLVDVNGKIIMANRAAGEIAGVKAPGLAGTPAGSLLSSIEQGRSLPIQNKDLAAHSGKDCWLSIPGKSPSPVNLSVSPVIDQAGDQVGTVIIAHDMTIRRRIEADLQAAITVAQEANRAKGDFLANLSHEIRTPMNAVLGSSDLLRVTPLSLEQKEYVDTICSSGALLMALITDILDIAKIESRKITLEEIPFDLEECINGVIKMLCRQVGKKTIDINLVFPAAVPKLFKGDPTRVGQVILNLVGNAIKFTEAGQVTVSVGNENTLPGEKEKLRISVKDTGIGIPKDKQEAIFSAFVQVDSSVTRKYGGTGLGLAISRSLVEMMGGDITVDSEPGKGSEFIVTLRLSPASAADT